MGSYENGSIKRSPTSLAARSGVQHGFYAEALRAHLRPLATIAGFGTISRSSGIVRFVQGGVVKTFRYPPNLPPIAVSGSCSTPSEPDR